VRRATTIATVGDIMSAMDISSHLDFAAPPADVYAMMTDQAYLEEVCVASESLSYHVSVKGSTTRTSRTLPAPDSAARFTGPQLTVNDKVGWGDPASDGSRSGAVTMTVLGQPVNFRGQVKISPGGRGSVVDVTGELKVAIPLLGRRLEKAAAPAVMAAYRTQQEVGDRWLMSDTELKGVSSIKDKVSEAVDGDKGDKSKDKKLKFTNIVEELDLPVPRAVAYQAWTQFEEFPTFMKKVENVEQQEDQTVEWKAQIFWSHRSWTAEIVDQVPNERIVWRSKGEKGHVDGAVTFHELTPDLTRMLINLEYYPQGLFERTGNLWRAQGRRVRLELKFFRRYITSEVLLRQDEVEGWPGEIHDGEVTEQSSDSEDQGSEPERSERRSSRASAGDGDSDASPTQSSAPRPAAKKTPSTAKKTASSAKASVRPRPTAKKSTPSESASRSRPTAKMPSGSASSSRGSRAEKSTSSSRSRS
jgi:uncharacterized membrane protein